MITQQQLKENLHYNPETGEWFRLTGRFIGKAGSVNAVGYLSIPVKGKTYLAHRLAWLYMIGEWPTFDIDHKDTDRLNCKWENLRQADKSKNGANRDKQKSLGYFSKIEDAALARANGSLKYQGQFARIET